MKYWALVFILLTMDVASGVSQTPTSFAAGTEITVEDYDARTNTFLLSVSRGQMNPPGFVRPEDLREAIGYAYDQETFMRQKYQMIGAMHVLKARLNVVESASSNVTSGDSSPELR